MDVIDHLLSRSDHGVIGARHGLPGEPDVGKMQGPFQRDSQLLWVTAKALAFFPEIGKMLLYEVGTLSRRMPAVAIADGATDGTTAVATQPNWDGRLLHRLGIHGDAIKVVKLAVEFGLILGPENLADLQILIADRTPVLV